LKILHYGNGNVALASHNEGSYAHYFSRINELESGEEIIYITNMGERRYEVIKSEIVEETDVKVLENTEENIITLITCVKGAREKRLCVIGKEKFKERVFL
jgi:sortase A